MKSVSLLPPNESCAHTHNVACMHGRMHAVAEAEAAGGASSGAPTHKAATCVARGPRHGMPCTRASSLAGGAYRTLLPLDASAWHPSGAYLQHACELGVAVRYVLAVGAFRERVDDIAQLQQPLVDAHALSEALACTARSGTPPAAQRSTSQHAGGTPTHKHPPPPPHTQAPLLLLPPCACCCPPAPATAPLRLLLPVM